MCAWQPLSRVSIGTVNPGIAENQSFSLTNFVPSDAKEVLIFATISTGEFPTDENDKVGILSMWTSNGPLEYKKHLSYHMFHQVAWSINSDNMSFPVTPDMTLYLSFEPPLPEGGQQSVNVYVTGYRT